MGASCPSEGRLGPCVLTCGQGKEETPGQVRVVHLHVTPRPPRAVVLVGEDWKRPQGFNFVFKALGQQLELPPNAFLPSSPPPA